MTTIRRQIQNLGVGLKVSALRKRVVRNYLAISGSEIALRPIQALKEYFVTKYLGPADYGLLKSIELIKMLNKYGSFGFKAAAAREIGDAHGKENVERANSVRNTAYTSELILALCLFGIGLISTLFVQSNKIAVLIALASAGVLVTKVSSLLAIEATIQKRFVLMGKISFITGMIASIVIIAVVPFLKIYAVVLMNAVVGVLSIGFYLKKLKFPYRFRIESARFRKILRVSFPFMLVTISQGSFKYAERLLVLGIFGKVALGFYGFALAIVGQFIVLFKAAMKVRTQDIYEAMGRREFLRVHRMVWRETGLLLGAALLLIPVCWFLVEMLVPVLLPEWQDGIRPTQFFLFVLPVQVLPFYAIPVLQSALINKQTVMPVFQGVATLILVSTTLLLQAHEGLSLLNFIIINLIANIFLSGAIIFLYHRCFYKVYIGEGVDA